MKKNNYKIMGATLALAAALTACSNNDFESAPAINGNGMITVFAPQGSNISTRTAYNQDGSDLKVTWNASGEDMYTINATADGWTAGQLKQVNGTSGSTSANFYAYDATASKRVSLNAGTLFAFYPQNSNIADKFTSLSSDGTTVSVPLTLDGQSGKLEDLQKYDYMTATSNVSVNNGETSVDALQMNHEIAVLHLAKGTEISMESGSVTKIELSATNGLYGSGNMTITRNGSAISSSISGTAGTITVNGNFTVADSKLAEDIYVAVLPTSSFTGLKAKFTYSNGDSYTYAYSGSTTQFAKGKMYNWVPEIAAEDKEFTLSDISQTSIQRVIIADIATGNWYCTHESNSLGGYTYTIDGLYIDTSTSESKVTFALKINKSELAKNMTFSLKSCTGVYRLWKTDAVDIDLKSFENVGWYGNSGFTGSLTSTPDASHLYGKFEAVLPDLNTNGSDFYKVYVNNCTFTIVSNYSIEHQIQIKYFGRTLRDIYKDADTDGSLTIYKYQLPDGSWTQITNKQYSTWKNK